LLLLYHSGYEVGKYISIEMHIEKTKNVYYDVLEEASRNWHEAENGKMALCSLKIQGLTTF